MEYTFSSIYKFIIDIMFNIYINEWLKKERRIWCWFLKKKNANDKRKIKSNIIKKENKENQILNNYLLKKKNYKKLQMQFSLNGHIYGSA